MLPKNLKNIQCVILIEMVMYFITYKNVNILQTITSFRADTVQLKYYEVYKKMNTYDAEKIKALSKLFKKVSKMSNFFNPYILLHFHIL